MAQTLALEGPLSTAIFNIVRRFMVDVLEGQPRPQAMPENDKWAEEFVRAAWQSFQRLIRFSTEGGYIGQVAPQAKVGDKIALLQGCQVPFVLRPTESTESTESNQYYSLVSTCYVQGLMYGEAWSETNTNDIQLV